MGNYFTPIFTPIFTPTDTNGGLRGMLKQDQEVELPVAAN
jgi:hypothetical protein